MPNFSRQNQKWVNGWLKNHQKSEGFEDYISVSHEKQENREKIRVVCCSDTHGNHRDIDIPNGDIFIHAGDFTRFGKLEDAIDFNNWLGDTKIFGAFKLKIVVNGNHEHNAAWQKDIQQILSNATFLKNDYCEYMISSNNRNISDDNQSNRIKIFGTDFFWPMKTRNPYYEMIPDDIDVLVCHGPIKGYVDGNKGCPVLLNRIKKINSQKSMPLINSILIELKRLFTLVIHLLILALICPFNIVFNTVFSTLLGLPQYFKSNVKDAKETIINKFGDLGTSFFDITLKIKQCFDTKSNTLQTSNNIRLVVSGHIHEAHGIAKMDRKGYTRRNTVFVNAAISNHAYGVGWRPIVVDL